jgi:hypothetical protein
MSTIEPVEMFKYRGKIFESEEKAVDHAEDLVGQAIKTEMLNTGFSVTDWVKVVQILIAKRKELRELMDY